MNVLAKIKKRRISRVRARVEGTASCPRLAVFRSNKNLSVQLIDDISGNTLLAASTADVKGKFTKTEAARELGKLIAEKAKALDIKKAVLDRRSYRYHGRVAACAEGARKGGLKI